MTIDLVSKIFRLLLLISPIAVAANIHMDAFDLIFFRTGVMVLFAASLLDIPKRSMPEYIKKLIFGLLGLCLINLFTTTFNPAVLATTMNIFLATVGFYIVYEYVEVKGLVKYILWAAAINLVFFIGQRMKFDPVYNIELPSGWYWKGAFLGNVARLGTYFALVIPFLPLPLAVLSGVMAIMTEQYIMFIPIVLMLFARAKNNKVRVGVGIICLLGLYLFRAHFIRSFVVTRFEVWLPALKIFFARPLLGCGLGVKVLNLDGMFCSYLQFAIGVGVLGLVWFGYVFKTIFNKLIINQYSIAFMTLAILMLIEYPIEITRLWYLIMAILVMAAIKAVKES